MKKSLSFRDVVIFGSIAIVAVFAINYFVQSDAQAALPSDFGLREGDAISANDTTDPDVYILNSYGYKRLMLSPTVMAFYGHLSFDKVKHVTGAVRDAFGTHNLYRNCETGDQRVFALQVTGEDSGILHWVNMSGSQAVAEDPNFFQKVFCINSREFNHYGIGSNYTALSQIPPYSRFGMGGEPTPTPTPTQSPTPTPTPGNVTVTLASDNPVGGTLVAGQATADLAHFQFTGNGTITNVTLRRLGVSGDTTLSSVYLYEGANRLTDAATVASGVITFNNPSGLFNVSGTKNISVKANIAAGTSGQTVGVQLTSYAVAGTPTNTSISGNIFTIATANMATVDFGATTTPTTATVSPQDDYTMWQNTINVGTRSVLLKSFRLRQIGSVSPGDLADFRLFVDGTQAATAASISNGYITFDLRSNPVTLQTGSRVIKMVGDIVAGSGRNFSFSLQQAADAQFTDSEFNADVLATSAGGTFSPRTTGVQTIDVGTLTLIKLGNSPSGNVVNNASGVTLARYEIRAAGEPIRVENLRVAVTHSGSATALALRNGSVYANGVQIGSTQAICADTSTSSTCSGNSGGGSSYTQFNFGSALTVNPGSPVTLEVRADIFDNDGTNDLANGQTLTAKIQAGSQNAQRLTSLEFFNFPSSAVMGNALTISVGTMTLSKYSAYADQNISVPNPSVKLGHYVLTANSTEDVNVNTVTVGFTGVDQWTAANLSDVFLRITGGPTVIETAPKPTVSSTTDSSYSVNFTLPAGGNRHVEVWGRVSSFTVAGGDDTMQTDMTVSGITAQSAVSDTTGTVLGQTLTAAVGSIVSAVDSSTPVARLAAGNTTVNAAAYNFTATNDSFTITEVTLKVDNAAAASAVQNVILKNGSTILGTLPLSGTSVTFSGLSVPVPLNGTVVLTADLQLANVGVGGAATGANVKLTLDQFKALDSNGTQTTGTDDRVGNNIFVYRSYPTITAQTLPTTQLVGGEQTLAKFNITANTADLAWKKIILTVNKSSAPDLTSFKLFEDGVDITSTGTFTLTTVGAGNTSGTAVFVATVERTVPTSGKTYEVRATVSGSLTSGDNVVISVQQPSGSTPATPAPYATVAATSASFVWSDKSAVGHSELTSDWLNDAMVRNLSVVFSLTR